MRNLLLTISFNGKNYHGWQVQKNAVTVQAVFQKALEKIIGEQPDLKGCSRTDSGVHANRYCVSFKTKHKIPCSNLILAMNKYLPTDIAVIDCVEVDLNFHARYSCIGKEYIYKIWNNRIKNPFLDGYALHYWYHIDEKVLNNASKAFLGTHDFTSFCTADNRKITNMQRTIKNLRIVKKGSLLTFVIEADGFLYNMVRIIIGTFLRISEGKISADNIPNVIKAKNRSKAGFTAKACGLYLNRVFYKEVDIK